MTERDRRWSLLRSAMKNANFDALIALPHEGHEGFEKNYAPNFVLFASFVVRSYF